MRVLLWNAPESNVLQELQKLAMFSYSCKEQSALVINYDIMLLIIKPPGKKYAILQKNSGLPKQATGKQKHSDTVKFGLMVTLVT